jgi:ADP-heptose:LPS heptosyltransferase
MKIALVVRYGAYGDMIMITPCLKKLKEMNYRVILNTGKRGEEVLRGSPLVDEFVMHDESLSIDNLNQHWEELKKKYSPDKYINFSESIECNVALHPVNSEYTYTKAERAVKCNKNYYEVTAKWAGLDGCQMFPELHFTEAEEAKAKSYIKEGKFNVVWGMSGSGRQKVYPWTEYVIGEVLRNHKDFQKPVA